MYRRTFVFIISAIIICTCIPNSRVSAGWPYLTKKQFIEGDWQLEPRSMTFTFKGGIIGIRNTVWGHYKSIDGWTFRFKRKKMEGLGIIVTIEKVGSDKMIWWITDMNGKKVRDWPLFTWIRQ